MSTDGELREFLTSRRAALSPQDVGLPPSVSSRRVAGLRREEVAILAGVSVDYYVKLEQGRAGNISEQVLEAIENALRLDELERRHLRSLLHPGGATTSVPVVRPKARPAVLNMVDALSIPAVVHGPLLEVLGTNALARALFDDFSAMPLEDRNLAKWMFTNPRARHVYVEWERHAAQMVAILRAAATGPQSTTLHQLVGELTIASPDFAGLWADYRLFEHNHGIKVFANDTVGELKLNYETLSLPGDKGQTVLTYSADPGSPSAEKLQLLSSWIAQEERPTRAARDVI